MRVEYITHTMFARFQQSETRITAVLADSRREGGRVVNEHIATLGSVPVDPTIADRIAFWTRANARLAKAGNRIGPDLGKVMGQLHARIPMVTPDEQRALQLENAKADERFWTGHREFSESLVESHKAIAATAERAAATAQASAADGAAKAAAARDRVERIERGEDVEGGLGKPLSYEDALRIMREAGMDNSDIRHMHRVGEIVELGGEEEYREESARRAGSQFRLALTSGHG
jgi:pyruvate/2-oxoglutarate dehydrogenase complex dihydrolipoamide acyltransferase (E2) component